MAGPPLDIGPLIALSHSILFGQVAIQFRAQRIQALPQCQLGVGEVGGIHAVLGLHLVKQLELTIRDMSILFYASQFFLFFRIEHPALSARGTSKRICISCSVVKPTRVLPARTLKSMSGSGSIWS